MTTLIVTKREVLDAIRHEPLEPGMFYRGSVPAKRVSQTCPVCAVGAVIRRQLAYGQDIVDAVPHAACYAVGDGNTVAEVGFEFMVDDELAAGRWWAALSCEFERLCDLHRDSRDKLRTGTVRRELARWVRAHLPDEMEMDVGDAKPRRGARVTT